jgi:succinoglycan biosynthesis transport protein ExoP
MARQMSPPPASPHLLHYLRVLSKRRWTALGTLLLVVGSVAVLTARTVPMFEARAQLMIEVERPKVVVFEGDETANRTDESQDYQETQRRILQSRTLASRTLETLELWQHPAFGGATEPPSALEARWNGIVEWFAALPAKISRSPNYVRGGLAQPEGPDPDEALGFKASAEQSVAIDRFINHLDVTQAGTSRIVEVSFRAADPKLAAAVVNALTDAYVEQNREFKSAIAKDAADWLAGQLEGHRKQLEESQTTLQRYREQRPDASGEGADLGLRRLESLNTSLMSARTDRIQKETLHNQVQSLRGDQSALESLQFVQADASLQAIKRQLNELEGQDLQLAPRFGERHPERAKLRVAIQAADARLKAALDAAVERVQNDYEAAVEQEQSLARAVESQKRESLAAAGKRAEFEGLARAAATDQEIFSTLLQRAKEAGVTTGLVASNIRVVDRATAPQSPVSPNPRRNLMMALFGGSLLALGLAFFRDYMDRALTTPEEIKAALGLPCLGLVPRLTGRKSAESPLVSDPRLPAAFQEAVRAVRTNVLFSSADEAVRTILVTSTGPGEGKTTVACNLAVSLAQTGRRVLIIDADMRKPRVHAMFQQSPWPGLSEAIGEGAPAAECAVGTPVPNLWLLPAGTLPPDPSDLLSSERCLQLITALSESFDWIIIDSPPVMAVTDASLLAHLAAGVLFVVAAEQTKSPAAVNALNQLDRANAKFVGAVLNGVNFKRNSFYYGDHYSRKYGDYYSAPMSKPVAKQAAFD